METITKLCLECGEPVGRGRIDRKFCSVECKNKHHNKESYSDKISTARIKKILDTNRKILKKMAARKDADQILKEMLLKEGLTLTTTRIFGFQRSGSINIRFALITDTGY